MLADIALVTGAYLLGSIPFLLIVAKAKGIDVAREKDLHAALWRKVGRWEGLCGILIDILKGVAPVVVGFALDFRLAAVASSGVAAVAGQMWPVFQKFNGERGNTTGLGMVAALTIAYDAVPVLLLTLIPALIGLGVRTIPRAMKPGQTLSEILKFGGPPSRSLPLGIAIGFAVLPASSWALGQPPELTLAFVALLIIVLVRRLTGGLSQDLKTAASLRSVLLNRLLYDRSYV